MIIVCDRCGENTVDFEDRGHWEHIEISEKGYGKLLSLQRIFKCILQVF